MDKTKERGETTFTDGSCVEIFNRAKFFGVHLAGNLSCFPKPGKPSNISTFCGSWWNPFTTHPNHLLQDNLKHLVWKLQRKTLQWIMRTAEKISGVSPPWTFIILSEATKPPASWTTSPKLCTLLPSGKKYQSIRVPYLPVCVTASFPRPSGIWILGD